MKNEKVELEEGDVVRLASGGLDMTVEEVSGGYADCVWSDGKRVYRDRFKVALLVHLPDSILDDLIKFR